MTTTRPTKITPWALVLSLAAHFLLLAPQLNFAAMTTLDEPKIVKASLIILPKLQPNASPTTTKPTKPAKPKKVTPPPAAAPQSPVDVTAEENVPPISSVPPLSSPSATSIAAAEQSGITPSPRKEERSPTPDPIPTPEPTPAPTTEAAHDDTPALHPLPVDIEIVFALYKGTNGLKVGRATHHWQIENGRYNIRNVIEATGIFSIIAPGQMVQTSQGKVTANGLEPEFFSDQRGPSEDKTFSSQFDREHQTLTYGRASDMTTVSLPPETQDLLSLAYQLSLRAPFTGIVQLSMTNGRKVGPYRYQVIGEEILETELGKLQTLHLSKVHQPGDEGADVWLAKDHQYLPVKIRLTDRKDGVAEQIVTAIRAK